MKQRISIVNKSSGKFSEEEINGRAHIVTEMMPIEGDSVMNELLYPLGAVRDSYEQLEMLPAPDMHPEVNGRPVSAFNPLAINAHNFGAFTRSPRMEGKRVLTDLVIDLDIANKSERGKKIVERIKSGKPIGVSTGLIAEIVNEEGKVGDREYNGTVMNIAFDHVAVLLDAMPAGENTYTLNHGEFKPKRTGRMFMDTLELDLTSLAIEDRMLLGNMKVNELLSHVKHEITVNEAKQICENAGLEFYTVPKSEMDNYLSNKDDFNAFLKKQQDKLNETKQFIVDNSKMDMAQLNDMSVDALESIANSVAPKNTHISNGKRSSEPELELIDEESINLGEG